MSLVTQFSKSKFMAINIIVTRPRRRRVSLAHTSLYFCQNSIVTEDNLDRIWSSVESSIRVMMEEGVESED